MKYPKILALGALYTENALKGEVLIEEKVDGSQFIFGTDEKGELIASSKNQIQSLDSPDKLFNKAVSYIKSIKDKILEFPKGSLFYGEYLSKEKHNVLSYERVPKNNIVIFDAIIEGKWVSYANLLLIANKLEVDCIPLLHKGNVDVEGIKQLLTTQSYLGKEIIEGVVVKNYNENIVLGGKIMPLFTKYVREEFKERHDKAWAGLKTSNMELFIQSFKSEARWQKAIIHLKEQGKLTQSLRDIGDLIKEIHKDIEEEEKEYIKEQLYKIHIDKILRMSTSGFPEFWKNKLLENLQETPNLVK